ncbi:MULTISPECIES: SDR family NAD(P)-dependent oxidoreductase [Sphingobium]|uniref:SDR family NAD(P)-dependent oxidoreductase n=1 Tax=Sphingobium TaxID=165695 RepID=UPI00159C4BF9|nr:SDR family NAD(P)-dependent oxidoreductase [Sphingobium sp. 15-1]
MSMDFAGRVAIVTGAGRGLGRSHALMLAAKGARVVVNDLAPESGSENVAAAVVEDIRRQGGVAVADHHDVATYADAVVQTAIDSFGRLDILVNNAGIVRSANFADAAPGEWNKIFAVHFEGTVAMCRAAWPHLASSGAGRIINTSSSGMLGNAAFSAYGSAKAAIFGLTRCLAMEGEAVGMTSNAILPSAWTRMADVIKDAAILETIRNHFQPEHVSALVVWLAHQDTVVNNEAFQVSGGRAARLTMAAYPSVKVSESTPEAWAAQSQELFAATNLCPVGSTVELFVSELMAADPSILSKMAGHGRGGLDLNATVSDARSDL